MGDVITIDTAINTKGFELGTKAMKSAITSLSRTANSLGRSIKQIVPSLIGVGSAFQIISKAAQSFLSQNEALTNQLSSAWNALGNLLGPIIERIIGWVTTAIQYITAFLRLLGVTGSTSAQTGKATEKAAASAKKGVEDLKRTLLGFDELNVLQEENSAQDQSGNAAEQMQSALQDIKPPDWMTKLTDLLKGGEFEEFGRELARMLNDAIENIPWADLGKKISNFFLGVLKALYGVIDEFDWRQLGRSIKTFIENIDWAEIRKTIFELMKSAWKGAVNLLWGFMSDDDSQPPPLIKSLQRLGESLGNLYTTIDDFIRRAWESELKPFLEWTTAKGLPWLIDHLSGAIDILASVIENHGPVILTLLESIGAAVLGLKIAEKVKTLIGMANPVFLILTAVAALVLTIGKYGDEIQAKLQELDDYLQGVFATDWTEVFGPILGGVLNGFFGTVSTIWENVKLTLDGIIDFIRGVFTGDWERAWNGISEIISGIFGSLFGTFSGLTAAIAQNAEEIKGVFQTITDYLSGIFTTDWSQVFGPVLGEILNGFFTNVKNTWDSVHQVLEGIIDFISGTFTGNWSKAWQGVRSVFEGLFSGIESILKSPLNGIISLINGAIGGINHLIDGANRLGYVVGFSIPYLNEIPYLAKGGVLKRGQIGLLEGDGAEAVVPLEDNIEWIKKVADQFREQLSPPPGMQQLSSLQDIAKTVSSRMPAIVKGNFLPYSVRTDQGDSDSVSTELLTVLQRIEERLDEMQDQMDNMQFVAQFDNLRALAQRITKEQRRENVAKGV